MSGVEYDASDKDREPFVEVDPTGRYGRYEDVLGRGAMKTVYRAFDQEDGIEVAWNKVSLQNRDDVSIQRIYAEVRLLKSWAGLDKRLSAGFELVLLLGIKPVMGLERFLEYFQTVMRRAIPGKLLLHDVG